MGTCKNFAVSSIKLQEFWMTFLAAFGNGVVPIHSSPPPQVVNLVHQVVRLTSEVMRWLMMTQIFQIGWSPPEKFWLRSQFDFSKCRGLKIFVGSEFSSHGPCRFEGPCHKIWDPRRCGTIWVLNSRVWIGWRA